MLCGGGGACRASVELLKPLFVSCILSNTSRVRLDEQTAREDLNVRRESLHVPWSLDDQNVAKPTMLIEILELNGETATQGSPKC